jgi:hypothetical protein
MGKRGWSLRIPDVVHRRGRLRVPELAAVYLVSAALMGGGVVLGQATLTLPGNAGLILEDFSKAEPDGFPQGWQASRSEAATRQAYVIRREGEETFLRTKGVDDRMRIKKRIEWDPKEFPIVTWRWRLRSVPQGNGLIAAVYISLDTDLLFIPVFTKYVWSPSGTVGALKEGGMFSGSEITVRTGNQAMGPWVEERVNAYADFFKIHKHEPSPKAWGISLVTGPGVELDFGRIGLARSERGG